MPFGLWPLATAASAGSRRLRAGIPVRFAHSNVVGTRFPLTPSENAAWGYVVAQRLDAPHFSTGGVAPYVAEVFSAAALKTSCYPP